MEKGLGWDLFSKMSYVEGLNREVGAHLIGKGFKSLGTRVAVLLNEAAAAK
jgi:hypothetical protein